MKITSELEVAKGRAIRYLKAGTHNFRIWYHLKPWSGKDRLFAAKKLWNQSWTCKLKNIRVKKEPGSLTDKLGSGRQVYPKITS